MIHKRTPLIVAALIAALTPFWSVSAFAATSVKSITLSPATTDLTILPSTAASREITIINDGDIDYTAKLSVSPYRVTDETYDPAFTRIDGTTDPSSWVKLSQTTIDVKAHQTSVVPYTVTAPKATAPGGYYAVIFAESLESQAQGSGVSTRNRVGNVLYIAVDGTVKTGGQAETAETPGFSFGSTVPLAVRVTNSGGVHFQSVVDFKVQSLFGKNVYSSEKTNYVLPQTTRLITDTWAPKSIFGIYKVSRTATVAGKASTLPDKWVVVATPSLIPLLIFIILALSGFIILFSRTKKSHKSTKKNKKE